MSAPSVDKNKNFADFGSQEEMMKMMEKLNLGQNMDMNQMRGGQMDQMKQNWGDDEDDLNQALNQISQNQNNQFGIGNMGLQDNLGGFMGLNNDVQSKPNQGNRNQGRKNNNAQRNQDNINIFGQMNPYLGFNNPLMGMNLGNLNQNNLNSQMNDNQLNINPALLNNLGLNQNLLNNYYSQGNNNLNMPNKSGLLNNMNVNSLLGINNN